MAKSVLHKKKREIKFNYNLFFITATIIIGISIFIMGFMLTYPSKPLQLTFFNVSTPLSWDDFAVLGMIVSLIGSSIIFSREAIRRSRIDDSLPTLLRDISEAGMVGVTLTRAIEVSAERNYGPLTKELKRMIAQLSWKVPLSKALKSFAERCNTVLSKKVMILIQEANERGGDVQESLDIVNQYVQEYQNQEKKRKTEMRPYIFIVYISFFAFIATAFIIITQFFKLTLTSFPTSAIKTNISFEEYVNVFFYIAIVESIFAGLIGGKISSGTIRSGFIHSTILLTMSFIVFNFLI